MPECLELPRPWKLLRTAGWSLTESAGLPFAAYIVAAWLDGRNAGLLAGLGAVWLTVGCRKVTGTPVPGLLTISALVLTLQTAVVIATGNTWVYLLQFPLGNLALSALFAKTAQTHRPLVAQLATEVVALRHPGDHHPGLHRFFRGATWLWAGVFFLLTAGLAVMMVTESFQLFMLLSTAVTAGLIAVGTGVSALWFFTVLRRFGLQLRFAAA
ncbi:MAG TPA: hypothetical protein VLW50_04350 [Streptosporangiaceae bacterium]|nr:hypothetical protein [Streptosporangiaceae bacterium]